MAFKIWCLFSVDNNYDQPPNNLVAWWVKQPSIETIAEVLNTKADDFLNALLRGCYVRLGNTDYRLEHINEGVPPP